ncbi:MAG: MerR family transcriptional regulator [Bacillota bacterium]|nr:MerR family transcriptional regulator [Bacillota bacterium]
MAELTLKELCSKYDVTRRAVQGYENYGLVQPSSKNKYGHLLYDEAAQKQVARIRLFQDFGFSLKEIQKLQNMSEKKIKAKLEEKSILLEKKKEELLDTLDEIHDYINRL